MIWCLVFKDKKSKQWFEKEYKKVYGLKLIHQHYEKSWPFEGADFYYDAGYLGYAEAREIIKRCKENGIKNFKELCLCDTKNFEVVKE